MGTAEIDINHHQLIIYSNIITYGNASNPEITESIRDEIETMWNEAEGSLMFDRLKLNVVFKTNAFVNPFIDPIEIYQNTDPRNNYFRIEEFVHGNISFVDSINCNSGYFKLENLYKGSTTAAHEYGHTLGLDHPQSLDIRGKGIPSIMYPRGTLVDAMFQYDPSKPAGIPGGTMHPMHRKVTQQDIDNLKIHKLQFHHGKAIIGEFTNIWHPDHASVSAEDFMRPPVFG
ncbi:MAG: peptidase M10 [Bacteroidetes bacterium]|nr:MAG: peptidase M10 [Bacteroidota bacterium]